jgi:predicted  nucleic acid-binding Zn-ribbon protein
MAEKKYIDLTGLTHYDEKIKAVIDSKDAAALKSAKDYADSLAGNYDAAGTAETKVQELANGQVKTNTAAISKLNGDAKTEGSVAKAVADAQAGLETKISAADAKAAAAQTAADNLKTYVGTIPEGATSTDVVSYVNEKTAGIATDASLSALTKRVGTAEGKITAAEGNITNLSGRADAVEGKVTTLIGEDTGKSARTIANEELTKQLIPENAKDSLNTLQEIAAWIQNHPDDASAMNAVISALKTKVGDIPEGATATTIVAYIKELVDAEKTRATGVEGGLDTRVKAVEAKLGDGDGSVAKQIEAAVKVETDARVAADGALDGKITTAQGAADKAQGDVDALKDVVASKAAASDVTALTTRVTAAEKDIDDLQAAIAADGKVTAAIADAKKAGTDAQATADKNKTDIATLTTTVGGHTTTLSSQGDRISALETKVGDGFVAITNEEIDNLFAAKPAV